MGGERIVKNAVEEKPRVRSCMEYRRFCCRTLTFGLTICFILMITLAYLPQTYLVLGPITLIQTAIRGVSRQFNQQVEANLSEAALCTPRNEEGFSRPKDEVRSDGHQLPSFATSAIPRTSLTFLPSTSVSSVSFFNSSTRPISSPLMKNISCSKLFVGDELEVEKAKRVEKDLRKTPTTLPTAESLITLAKDCKTFIRERGYNLRPLSTEEEHFPIAFSILLYKAVDQMERLLRAIYHVQNAYCLHVDTKASRVVHEAASAIASCLPNVFVASRNVEVRWGWFSVVEPELICMQDLLQRHKRWKYFINLTGQEFPLKTNAELVKILTVYNGQNDIDGEQITPGSRFVDRVALSRPELGPYIPLKQRKAKTPFKYNMTYFKGAVHIVASREFVNYTVKNPIGRDFQQWCRDVSHPDEVLFNSLNHNPNLGVPGAYKGWPQSRLETMTRFKMWEWYSYKCRGHYSRSICIISVGDLAALYNSPKLFVNKLYASENPVAFSCLEELLFNRTRHQDNGYGESRPHLNVSIYERLNFVLNR